MDDHLTGILSNIGVISFVALSAYLLLLTGEISFGQQAFFAIGAYTAGIVPAMWQLPFWLGLGAGAATGGAAALFVGLPTCGYTGCNLPSPRSPLRKPCGSCSNYSAIRSCGTASRWGRTASRVSAISAISSSTSQRDAVHADHLRVARDDAVWIFLLERSRLGVAFRMIDGWPARRRTGRPGVPRKADGGLPCRRDRRPRRRALCASHDYSSPPSST